MVDISFQRLAMSDEVASGGSSDILKANPEELEAREKFAAVAAVSTIPIPYVFVSGGVNVTGIFNLRSPVEDSNTEGVAIGAIVGTYFLNKDRTTVSLYDPTSSLLRLDIEIRFANSDLRARICRTDLFDGWKCGGWETLASW
jgi:hypothetical protein